MSSAPEFHVNHDIIAIGGSAGALEVLLSTVGELPADPPASVFVVLHSSPDHRSLVPELLSSRGIGVIQDPEVSLAPSMPRSVLNRVKIDHVYATASHPGKPDVTMNDAGSNARAASKAR